MNHWVQTSRQKKLEEGKYTGKVSFGGTPQKNFNLRPISTVTGRVVEWQLLLVGNKLDYSVLGINDPTPGHPILSEKSWATVLRFHPDDVEVEYK